MSLTSPSPTISISPFIDKESDLMTWTLGFVFVTIISLSSVIGLLVIPTTDNVSWNDGRSTNYVSTSSVHNALEGLALGSLLSSSLFHLIPHAFDLVGQDLQHKYLTRSLLIFAGIYLFYWSEKLIIIFGDYYNQRSKVVTSTKKKSKDEISLPRSLSGNKLSVVKISEDDENCSDSYRDVTSEVDKKATLAWMIILGDAIHNFIDGLSLGAALTDSILTGFSISIAILFEEIPHELGDFAILLSTGMSAKRAALYNLASASTCYLGMIVGIYSSSRNEVFEGNMNLNSSSASDNHSSRNGRSNLIFAIAGGMFLYISLFNVASDLNDNFNSARKVSNRKAFKVLLMQNIGILFGVCVLYSLAGVDEQFIFQTLSLASPHQA